MSLFWRVFLINATVLVGATAFLAVSPVTVSDEITVQETIILAVGVVLVLAVNFALLARTFGPLERLASTMSRVDPLEPGRRVREHSDVPEVDVVVDAFNDMIDRLERERRESGRRALSAQEFERRRLARELHDQVGQTLTGVVLQLESLARTAPPEVREDILATKETARSGVEQMRAIARGLRPDALDDFGLRTALVTLTTRMQEQFGLRVRRRIAADLPGLPDDHELVVYRVAQESLTNVARHAGADSATLALGEQDGALVLSVSDDGHGFSSERPTDGTGLRGMRERAMLVGGRLDVITRVPGGTEIRLTIPLAR